MNFDVYNLDVQGHHNFYASEVLVHNCNAVAGALLRSAGEAEAKAAVNNLSNATSSAAKSLESKGATCLGKQDVQSTIKAEAADVKEPSFFEYQKASMQGRLKKFSKRG